MSPKTAEKLMLWARDRKSPGSPPAAEKLPEKKKVDPALLVWIRSRRST